MQKTGDLVTLHYLIQKPTLVDQPFASKTINVNPFDVRTFTVMQEQLTPDPPDE